MIINTTHLGTTLPQLPLDLHNKAFEVCHQLTEAICAYCPRIERESEAVIAYAASKFATRLLELEHNEMMVLVNKGTVGISNYTEAIEFIREDVIIRECIEHDYTNGWSFNDEHINTLIQELDTILSDHV